MSSVVVLGCGELAWARPSLSPLGDRQWKRGRFLETIHLGQGGLLPGSAPGEDWIKPSDEIDRLDGWSPAAALGPPARFSLLGGQPAEAPPVPAWPDFATAQARWVTRELGAAGFLVTPAAWRTSEKGRQLLSVWAGEGWSWNSLEEVVGRRIAGAGRFAASAGLWLRVMQGRQSTVLPNGPEAARAIEVASSLIGFALGRLDGAAAARWRREEESSSGWVVRQQAARRIMGGLLAGRTTVELGTEAPLFHFSSEAARRRYEVLAAMRVAVEVPPAPMSWWDRVSEPGFLLSRQGLPHPGIEWREPKTILLQGPDIRQLAGHLAARNLPRELADPARLEDVLAPQVLPPQPSPELPRAAAEPPPPGAESRTPPVPFASPEGTGQPSPLPPAAVQAAVRPEAAAAIQAQVQAAVHAEVQGQVQLEVEAAAEGRAPTEIQEIGGVSTLPTYQPSRFSLDVAHQAERMRVWVEGQRIEPGDVRRSRQGHYTLDGAKVAHGAVVRIDFDPVET